MTLTHPIEGKTELFLASNDNINPSLETYLREVWGIPYPSKNGRRESAFKYPSRVDGEGLFSLLFEMERSPR